MSLDQIQTIEVWEAIRKRPAMYAGPLDDPLMPNRLLEEALCMARSAALNGEGVTRVDIRTLPGGFAVLEDDGPGWDVSFHPSGKRLAERLLRDLFACRAAKTPEHQGVCNVGVVTLVALCEVFGFKTYREGRIWTQSFRAGKPVTAFEDQGPTDKHGTQMSFKLDNNILHNVEFSEPALQAFAETLRNDGLQVSLAELVG